MSKEAKLLIAQDYVDVICNDDISRVDDTKRSPTLANLTQVSDLDICQ
jgi:hypothetical protein